jgi:oxalate decarboxylase/phosphoglucose isomerase-like protein (cupin superfamily)
MIDKLLDFPDTIRVGADTLRFRATSDETGGDVLAVEVTMPPGGGPPMLHRHSQSEIYRVEAGEFAIYLEDAAGTVTRLVASAGDVIPIAGGRQHTIRNESDADARAYVVFAPGASMETFVRAAAESGGDVPKVLSLAAAHGIEMTGPLPEG